MVFKNNAILKLVIIFILVHKVYNEDIQCSLTFVIDDTGSMEDEIEQVILRTNDVFDAVLNANSSIIDNFILVTFNDPDVELRTITKDRDEFKSKLAEIEVDGGGLCPEMAMTGIDLAVESSLPNSFLYVFTDASAEDFKMYEQVQRKALKKSIQVTFLLTGTCDNCENCEDYQVYYKLAKATGGQVFNMEKNEIKEILDYVIDTIRDKKVSLFNQNFPSKDGHDVYNVIKYPFSVDSKMKKLTLSLVGKEPELDVIDSNGRIVKTQPIINKDRICIIKMEPVVAGNYTAVLKSFGESNLDIKASSDLSFQYGFTKLSPATKEDIISRPVAGEETHLTIELSNEEDDVTLKTAQLLNLQGNIITEMPLHIANERDKFYMTGSFVSPNDMFKIAINGIVTTTKENIRRVSTTAVEPWSKSVPPEETEEFKPFVEDVRIIYNDTSEYMKLICKVKSHPEPKIIWIDRNGLTLSQNKSVIDDNYYISILEIKNIDDNDFKCIAENIVGYDEKNITFTAPREAPQIDKSNTEYFKERGQSLDLLCRVTKGRPEPTISWLYKQNNNNDFVKLANTEKLFHLDKLGLGDAGTYKCVSENSQGHDSCKMVVYVQYPPYIDSGPESLRIAAGKSVTLRCVVNGSPTPSVQWFYNGIEITSGGRYSIYRNHTLRFIANTRDSGKYTCEASNSLGIASGSTQLDVYSFIPASIKPPERRVYNLDVGSNISLDCIVEGFPKPKVGWTFAPFDKHSKPTTLRAHNESTLTLKHIGINEAGYYICVANNSDDFVYIFYEIHLEAPPWIITKNISKSITVVNGDISQKIQCDAYGNPKPDIIWTKDGHLLTLDNNYDMENGTLILKHIDPTLGGIYSCVASNAHGSASEIFEVNVLPSPTISAVTSELYIEKDKITDIECKIPHNNLGSIRWYKNNVLLKDGTLSLYGKISDSSIYTCRVSNFKGSTNYQVKVSVCFGPTFDTEEPTTINYVEGKNVYLNCAASAYPIPEVVWYKHERRLKTVEMYHETNNIGTFTCEVRNGYGEISRTFKIVAPNCTLNTKTDFAKPEPLILTRTSLIPRFDIIDNIVHIPKNETIFLHCRNSYLQYRGENLGQSLNAYCDQNDDFILSNTQKINFKELKCKEPVKSTFRNTRIKCSYESKRNSMLMIGYKVNTQFVPVYEVCFNLDKNTPIYSRYLIHKSTDNVISESKYEEEETRFIDFDSLYDCDHQKSAISNYIWKIFHSLDTDCFKRRQMVNPKDVFPGMQAITFKYLNVAPQWSSYESNWEEIERRVRTLGKSMDHGLSVWTGVARQLELSTSYGKSAAITIPDKNKKSIIVPKYWWKAVHDEDKQAGVAIIQINVPDISSQAEAEKYVVCKDICDEIKWLKNSQWKNYGKGYTFCCTIPEFIKAFKTPCPIRGGKRVLT